MTWQRIRLKHLSAVPISNGVGERGEFDNREWPRYVRTTDIAGPRALRTDVFASLPPEIAAKAPLRRGDIVMTAAGATVGKSMLYDSDEPACYAGYLARFRPSPDVDPRFVSYWTESAPYWDQVASGKVMSTIDNFSASKYQNMSIDVPTWGEQRAIADYLDSETTRIDDVVRTRQRQVWALAQKRSSLVVQRMTGGSSHHPGMFSQPPTFPEDWRRVRLRYLVGPVTAGDWGEEPTGNDDTLVVRAADFDRIRWKVDASRLPLRHIEHASMAERELRPGDLVLEKSGGGPDQPVGAVVLYDLPTRAVPSNFAARLRPLAGVDPGFGCYVFAAAYAIGLNQRSIKQTTGIQNLDVGSYLSEAWWVPSLPEQVGIREAIDREQGRIDGIVAVMTDQITALHERRQALISAAVTGQLAIPGVAA